MHELMLLQNKSLRDSICALNFSTVSWGSKLLFTHYMICHSQMRQTNQIYRVLHLCYSQQQSRNSVTTLERRYLLISNKRQLTQKTHALVQGSNCRQGKIACLKDREVFACIRFPNNERVRWNPINICRHYSC